MASPFSGSGHYSIKHTCIYCIVDNILTPLADSWVLPLVKSYYFQKIGPQADSFKESRCQFINLSDVPFSWNFF